MYAYNLFFPLLFQIQQSFLPLELKPFREVGRYKLQTVRRLFKNTCRHRYAYTNIFINKYHITLTVAFNLFGVHAHL